MAKVLSVTPGLIASIPGLKELRVTVGIFSA